MPWYGWFLGGMTTACLIWLFAAAWWLDRCESCQWRAQHLGPLQRESLEHAQAQVRELLAQNARLAGKVVRCRCGGGEAA
jgi:starvation-inducible outer membrane lipoprotein